MTDATTQAPPEENPAVLPSDVSVLAKARECLAAPFAKTLRSGARLFTSCVSVRLEEKEKTSLASEAGAVGFEVSFAPNERDPGLHTLKITKKT